MDLEVKNRVSIHRVNIPKMAQLQIYGDSPPVIHHKAGNDTISTSLIQTCTASEPYAARTVWKGILFYTEAAFITEVCARK